MALRFIVSTIFGQAVDTTVFVAIAFLGTMELKDLGFTKLVTRDDGIYENVTARDKDSRYVVRDKPETLPNLKKTIRD